MLSLRQVDAIELVELLLVPSLHILEIALKLCLILGFYVSFHDLDVVVERAQLLLFHPQLLAYILLCVFKRPPHLELLVGEI